MENSKFKIDLSKRIIVPKHLDKVFNGEFIENDSPTKDYYSNRIIFRHNNYLCCRALSFIIKRNIFIFECKGTKEDEYRINYCEIFKEIGEAFNYNRVILVLAHEVIENQTQLENSDRLCGKFDAEVAKWACSIIRASKNFSFNDYGYVEMIKYDIGSDVLNVFLHKVFVDRVIEPSDFFTKT